MIQRMTLRVDKSLRVVCGLGLMLLAAAQEKVCSGLTAPLPEQRSGATGRKAAEGQPSGTGGEKKKPQKQTPKLPFLLPDAAVPRWPAVWSEARPLQSGGWHDGVVSCGQRTPATGHSSAEGAPFDRLAWHCFCAAFVLEPAGLNPLQRVSIPPTHPALHTCIRRTGPPLG